MDKLLDDLLAYSRSGRYAYPIDVVDTRQFINDLLELMAPGFIFTLNEKLPSRPNGTPMVYLLTKCPFRESRQARFFLLSP